MLNEILNNGKLVAPYSGGGELDFSNVLVVTAMNFSQSEIEIFSQEILGVQKSFWDYTEEDAKKLDEWFRSKGSSDAAASKILSRLFRPNTISRLLPDLLIAKPLYGDDFLKIVKINVDAAIKNSSQGSLADKQLQTTYTDAYVQYLRKIAVFSPVGARKTVKRSDMLTQQLMNFAIRAQAPLDESFNRPRKLQIDVDAATDEIVLRITPQIKKGKGLQDDTAFTVRTKYDGRIGSFVTPPGLRLTVPKSAVSVSSKLKPVTRAEIQKSRNQPQAAQAQGLAKKLDQTILGQEDLTRLLEGDLSEYLALEGKPSKPIYRIFAGFSGTGKTLSVQMAGQILKLPVVKINLQDFSSEGDEAAQRFAQDLAKRIETARAEGPDGKYIVLLEEIDKANEVDPNKGDYITRPVMAHVKDLLNEGVKKTTLKGSWDEPQEVEIDIRDAYTVAGLNLPIEQFDFKADPNMTTHEDMWHAYKTLTTSPQELRKVLRSIFRTETVNRFLSPRLHIVRPLREKHYEQILKTVVQDIVKNRFLDADGVRNIGGVSLKLTAAYRRYLLREAIIPSEQARQASEAFRAMISRDVTSALEGARKNPALASAPMTLTLDYRAETDTKDPRVLASVTVGNKKSKSPKIRVQDKEVELRFPPAETKGKLPEERVFTAVHEFGHAFTAIYLGLRFEVATVIPPEDGVGGYVKFMDGPIQSNSAKKLVAHLYSGLGSRAMERIFLSNDPAAQKSVLDITAGAKSDIQGVTKQLWKLVYQLGMAPTGGVIERGGLHDDHAFDQREYFFEGLSQQKVEELGRILRDTEDALVEILLKAHPKKFYREKILEFAQKGTLSERAFYDLVGMPHPGNHALSAGELSPLQELYAGRIRPTDADLANAQGFKLDGKTTIERMNEATSIFEKILAQRLGRSTPSEVCRGLTAPREE